MKKVKGLNKRITRQHLANPYSNLSYRDRLIKSGAIDLRDNHRIIDMGNGYSKIEPIDETKKVK